MIADHRTSTTGLKKAVADAGAAAGLTVPPEMLLRHATMLASLQQATGGAFDRLYIEQQRTAHAEALDLHRGMALRAGAPAPLKAFAAATAPVVEKHHQMLLAMNVPGMETGASGTTGQSAPADTAVGTMPGGNISSGSGGGTNPSGRTPVEPGTAGSGSGGPGSSGGRTSGVSTRTPG
jgi:hypothetical protein